MTARNRHRWTLRAMTATAGLAASLGAAAEGPRPGPVPTERPLWEAGLGVAALRMPHYRGSAQSHAWLLPAPYVVYRGRIFRADRDGVRARLIDQPDFDVDVSVAGSAPTRSDDDVARRGMPDLKPTFEIGPQLNVTLARAAGWKLDLRVPVRAAFTLQRDMRSVGWLATPHLNVDFARLSGWSVGVQAGPIFGDRRQHAYFYDVDPVYARPDRPAWRAQGGYAGAKALVGVSRRFDGTWVGAFARVDTLAGARIAASPLVGERTQWSVGVAVSWIFATSERRVPAAD